MKNDATPPAEAAPGQEGAFVLPSDPEEIFKHYEREYKRKDAENQDEIAALCADLERVLAAPCPDTDALARQADVLDCLFYTVMRHNLCEDLKRGYFNEDRLNMALRIQKQCADTLKTSGALDYMNAIAPFSPAPMRKLPFIPLPLENGERNDEI